MQLSGCVPGVEGVTIVVGYCDHCEIRVVGVFVPGDLTARCGFCDQPIGGDDRDYTPFDFMTNRDPGDETEDE